MPITDYARQVGQTHGWVQECAYGWDMIVRGLKPADDLADAQKLANMSQDRATATDAVAKAEGISVSRAKDGRKDDVKRVREAMNDYAERHPESTPEDRADVARRTAHNISTSRKLERDNREKLLRSQPHLLTELLGEAAKAREALIKMRSLAKDADPSLLPAEGLDRVDNALQEVARLTSDARSLLGLTQWDTAGLS